MGAQVESFSMDETVPLPPAFEEYAKLCPHLVARKSPTAPSRKPFAAPPLPSLPSFRKQVLQLQETMPFDVAVEKARQSLSQQTSVSSLLSLFEDVGEPSGSSKK